MNRREFYVITKKAFRKWQANNATIRSAAIAFFTALALPSVLLIIMQIFTLVYGKAFALPQLVDQIASVAGPTIAKLVGDLLADQTNPFASSFEALLTATFAVAGALGVFVVLRDTFDALWETPRRKYSSLKTPIKQNIVPFLMVSSMGFIVVAWTGITNVLFLSIGFLLKPTLGGSADFVLGTGQILLSFALTVLLFAIIYKELPNIEIEWKDVVLAALLTSLASTILNYVIGVYIATFSATSLVGTAGTMMVLMLWIFLTDEFILFGAQFSKIYTETVGSHFQRAESESLELHRGKPSSS